MQISRGDFSKDVTCVTLLQRVHSDATAGRDNKVEIRTRRLIRSTGEVKLRRLGKDEYELSIPAPNIESGSYGHEQVRIEFN